MIFLNSKKIIIFFLKISLFNFEQYLILPKEKKKKVKQQKKRSKKYFLLLKKTKSKFCADCLCPSNFSCQHLAEVWKETDYKMMMGKLWNFF